MHFLAGLALLSGTYALPSARSSYAVKEAHPVPRSWIVDGPAEGTRMINMQFGLKQANAHLVDEHMAKSTDPDHEMFRQHLSLEELTEMTKPSPETVNAVSDWLSSFGISNLNYSPAKDWIYVRLSVEQAEDLLQTTYSKFRHAVSGEELVRAPEWSLPVHLHEHIEVVQPTTSFFRTKRLAAHPLASDQSWSIEEAQALFAPKAHSFAATASSDSYPPLDSVCNATFVTPECIRTLYKTLNYEPQAADKNNIAITNYLNETNYRNDIFKFLNGWRNQTVAQSAYTFKRIIVANGQDDQGPYTPAQIAAGHNEEGNLDAENVLSVAYPTPLWAYNIGGEPPFVPDLNTPTDTNEPYLNFVNYVQARSAIPYVVTSSYGDDEQSVPPSYARAVCNGFKNMGARGITILVSSGDAGVGPDGLCFTNTEPSKPTFLPAFPAGCPWVTSVGGTFGYNPEVAVRRFASGAGFSNYFPRPSWQNDTVNKYVASLGGEYKGLYNQGGRAYPDVAAQSNADVIVWNSRVITIGGTSASSPTFAAVLSLVNDALLAAGKPSLGFINPWLYKTGYQGLNDITIGSSYGCNTTGFPAQAGWDAVTGFGTPDFPKLLALAQQGGYRSS